MVSPMCTWVDSGVSHVYMGQGSGVSCVYVEQGSDVSRVHMEQGSGVSRVCDVSGVEKREVEQRNRKNRKGRERTKGSQKEEESQLSCVLTRHGREWLLFTLPKLASAGSIAMAVMLAADVGKCH